MTNEGAGVYSPSEWVDSCGSEDSLAGITARDGLLWRLGAPVSIFEADRLARANGYEYAEGLVRALGGAR